MASPEDCIEIYSEYKKKLSKREINKGTEYEAEMPHDWAEIIAKRVASGELENIF